MIFIAVDLKFFYVSVLSLSYLISHFSGELERVLFYEVGFTSSKEDALGIVFLFVRAHYSNFSSHTISISV